jgi:nitrite reductase/ring-hydroxylating ferredoxin subunit
VTPTAPSPLLPLVEKLESLSALDGVGKAIGKAVRGAVPKGTVKDALSGTWLGHALHPLLTDLTIGSFLSATLLDVLGGDDDGGAAERLLAVGIASYGPTALTGFSDWADTEIADERVRRVGLAHAWTNLTALTLYSASLAARRSGSPGRGKALGLAGTAAMAGAGYLGAHMSFVRGVGPNQTAFDEGPSDWTEAIASSDLEEGDPKAVVVDDTPVMLLRHRDHLHALHDRCSHRGCSLADGEMEGEIVTCPCHGSQFSVRDGSVQRGPATAPQPVYDVRERDGRIELRLPE